MAADIRVAAGQRARRPRRLVDEWMKAVGEGVAGYVTPKIAVGAVVGNDEGRDPPRAAGRLRHLAVPDRAGPTSATRRPRSSVKEVHEETGIECEPVRLIAVLDGLRLGFTRIPLYSLVFHCRAVGGELRGPSARVRRRRLVRRGRAARRRSPASTAGATHAFAAIRGEPVDVALRRAPRRRSGATRRADRRRRDCSARELVEQGVDDRDRRRRRAPTSSPMRVVVDQAGGVGRRCRARR